MAESKPTIGQLEKQILYFFAKMFYILIEVIEVKVSSKGQITIPKEIREKLNLSPGEEIVFEQTREGFVLKRKKEELFPRDEPGADSPLTDNTATALSLSRGSLKNNDS